jgi:autotransporter-associated beta strand protein
MKKTMNRDGQKAVSIQSSHWSKIYNNVLASVVLFAAFSAPASASPGYVYKGPNGGQWGTNTNWANNTVPNSSAADALVASSTPALAINVGGTFTVRGLAVTGTGAFNLNGGTLVLSGVEAGINAGGATVGINSTLKLTGDSIFTSSGQLMVGLITGTGSLSLGNSGTYTLSGANTYNGDTYLFGGKLILGNSQSLGNGTLILPAFDPTVAYTNGITIANNIKQGEPLFLEVDNSDSATQSGNISDFAGTLFFTPQPVTKIGTGTLILSGVDTYTGTTTISAGTLQFAKEVSLYNNLTGSWTATNIAVKSGATLGLNVGGAGQFTSSDVTKLLGLGTATGGFQSGSNIAFDTTNASGGTFTYGNVIANPNGGANALGLTKLGSGTLYLTAANTYTGGTTINAGTLQAGNSNALGTGAVTFKGGTLQTDNLNHVINIGGNFVQTGGTLFLNINGAPGSASNDVVNVNGTAALGGNLAINYTPGSLPPNQKTTYTVVTTTGGVTSAGAGYTTPTLFAGALKLSVTGITVGNNFDVTLTSSQTGFIPLPGANYTSNQRAVAAYFDQFDTTLASGPTLLLLQALDGVSVNPAELGSAFDQLVPTRFQNFTNSTAVNNFSFWVQQLDEYIANHRDSSGNFVASTVGIDTTGFAVNNPEIDGSLQSVSSRLLAWNPAPMPGLLSDTGDPVLGGIAMNDPKNMAGSPMTEPWDVFINGNVVLAQDFSDPSAGIAGANSTTGAVQVGADYRFNSNFLLGLTFAYGQTYATLDTIGSNATVNTYSPGIYASYSDGGWYANGLGSYGFANYNQNRHVAIGAFNGTATSNPAGDQFLTNFDGGYNFHKGNWTYGPTAGLQFMHISVDGYTETGLPGANLTVGQNQGDSLRSLLGGRVAYEFHGAGMTFEPYFNASWQHEYLNQSRGITTQFNGIGAGSFVINTPNPSENSAVAQLGMNAQINNALMTFVDYTVQAGQSNYFGQSVQAGFKVGF